MKNRIRVACALGISFLAAAAFAALMQHSETTIPVPAAEDEGFTHLLVLLTRPANAAPSGGGALDRYYVVPRLRRLSPALASLYEARGGPYASLLNQIGLGRGPGGRARVLGLQPTLPEVSKLEKNADRLRQAARDGFDVVIRAFGPSADAPRPS